MSRSDADLSMSRWGRNGRTTQRAKHVPRAPGGLPIAGHILQWRADPVKLLDGRGAAGRRGPARLPGATYFLNHPRHVKHVLQDNHQNYCKGWVFDRIKPYWGESLLTADGDTWRQQRRRVQPSFKREHTAASRRSSRAAPPRCSPAGRRSAASGQPLSLYNEMTELALVIIGDVLFGVDLWADAAEMAKAAQSALAVLKKRVAALAPLPLWIPTSDNRRFNGAMRMLNDRISRDRRAQTARRQTTARSFLAMLMTARDAETGAAMTDKQLHEEILGMLQQGHDTVGESLAWTWYLLSLHPEVERKLHREIARGASAIAFRSLADLPQLHYAHMILQESLRCIRRSGSSRATRSTTTRLAAIAFPAGHDPAQPVPHPPPSAILGESRGVRPRSLPAGALAPIAPATPIFRSAAGRACAWASTWR